jgi:hypothetical protein
MVCAFRNLRPESVRPSIIRHADPDHETLSRQDEKGATGSARSRPEGATSAELFTATGWKFASWSHQLKLTAAASGLTAAVRKVDGTTRYFLTHSATAPPADAPAPEAAADETATTDATGEAEREQEAA